MNHPFKLKNAALVMALMAIYPLHVHAASGIAQFAVGDVNIRRGQTTAALNRGQQINSGDSIVTGRAGQTQIRFSDGGLVSLAPNSQFNIDKYADENKPEEDGFFASFLRGGMRAVTGLVGKRNRENYKITTTTATIGIRGSAFSANYNDDKSINVAGEQDGIVVCTKAGCVELIVGEAVRVTSDDTVPKRTAERSNVPPLVAREDLFQSVNPEVIQSVDDQVNGTLPGVSAMFAVGQYNRIDSYPRGGVDPSTGEGTFVNGLMVRHVVPDSGMNGLSALLGPSAISVGGGSVVEKTSSDAGDFGTVGVASDPAFIGWGYWDSGRSSYSYGQELAVSEDGEDWTNGVHYLVGRPTFQDQMPMSGIARYTLIGGTAPTAFDDYVLRVGSLNSAGLIVDFGRSAVNGFINTTFVVEGQSIPVQIAGYGSVNGSRFEGYDNNENGRYYGFFTGDGAARAGLVYETYEGSLGTIHGAAVFLKGDLERQEGVSALFVSSDGYFQSYSPSGGVDPSLGIGYFVGDQLYLHDDGAESDSGYGGYGGYGGSADIFAAAGPISSFGSSGDRSAENFIGWGYWAKGTYNGNSSLGGVHYIVGRPTANSDMPMTGVAQYSMISGSAPTSSYNGVSIMGRLAGASLSVDFFNGSGTATVNTVFREATSPVNVNITNEPINFGRGNARFNSGFCGNNISGFFVGSQATRAGMVYSTQAGSSLGTVSGAVGLQRGAITPGPNEQ